MVMFFGHAIEAVRAAVGMNAADDARVAHGVEVVVNRRHRNGRHLEFGKEKNLVRRQVMAVGLVQNLQNQGSLFGHFGSPHKLESL